MQDSFSALLVIIAGVMPLFVLSARYKHFEVRLMSLSLVAHIVAGAAQVVLTLQLYGGGDIFGYARKGEELAAALRVDFLSIGWELLKVLFQQPGNLPLGIAGIGSSTGSMTVIATIISFLTGGGIYTGCILLGIAAFYGKLAIYDVFRRHFPERLHRRLLMAMLLVPSVVFWSSGLLKESVAMVGFGPIMLGAQQLVSRRFYSGVVLLVVGAVMIGLVKAYILFAFVLAGGAWLYAVLAWNGRIPQLKPAHLVVGLGAATLGLALLSKLFPQYALDALAEQAALQQEMGQRARGGSSYELISDAREAGLAVQLAYAPLALLTSLYRPLLIEASNPQILVNALETTALLVLSIFVIWRLSVRALWTTLLASPLSIFSVTFVLMFGIAVGLATTNLGTLSRYRMPLVPFFASLLFILLDAAKVATSAPTQRLPLAPRGPTPSQRPVRPLP